MARNWRQSLEKSLEKNPWVLIVPPLGFLLYFAYPKTKQTAALFLLGFIMFLGTFVLNFLAYYFVKLSPFFVEPFFMVLFRLVDVALILGNLHIVTQVYLHRYDFEKMPWLQKLSRWKWSQRIL